jgi:hypothetical protein
MLLGRVLPDYGAIVAYVYGFFGGDLAATSIWCWSTSARPRNLLLVLADSIHLFNFE